MLPHQEAEEAVFIFDYTLKKFNEIYFRENDQYIA